jgi:hypothetical protein
MESNAYQDRVTTLQNELNHECTIAETWQVIAAAAGTAPKQQPHIQPVSFSDPERFDSSREKL